MDKIADSAVLTLFLERVAPSRSSTAVSPSYID